MQWYEVMCMIGFPGFLFSIFTFLITRKISKVDARRERQDKEREEARKQKESERDEREKRVENFLMAILSSQRATNTLATATAKAVQRIPDAHCNGDMHVALEEAERCQKQESEFLMTLGIQALNK